MGIWDKIKKVASAGAREVSADYSKNRNFLEAVCAASALVANADGSIDDTEKNKATQLISKHSVLSKMYDRNVIESTLETAFTRSKDASGRQALARDLDSIRAAEGGAQMSEDVYLVALDIANADGSISDDEQATLNKLAKRLGVDTAKFEF